MNRLKLGISTLRWTNHGILELGENIDFETRIEEAARAGFTGIELGRKFLSGLKLSNFLWPIPGLCRLLPGIRGFLPIVRRKTNGCKRRRGFGILEPLAARSWYRGSAQPNGISLELSCLPTIFFAPQLCRA